MLSIMKEQVRILGVDDGPFNFKQKTVPIIGVIIRAPNYIEGISCSEITIDGTDANSVLEKMINESKYKDQIRLIMFDGIALGGFNVIDLEKLYNSVNIPISSITRTEPDLALIKNTLKKHFKDWETRWQVIDNLDLERIETNYRPIYVKYIGLSSAEVRRLINLTTVRGVLPEPIRVAHLIASAIIKGESYGRA